MKYSKSVPKGTTLTCPECGEVFTPPRLKKKSGYDPTEEDTFAAGEADTADETDKSRHAAAAVEGGKELGYQFEEPEPPKRGLLEDPNTGLLLFGFAATGGLPFVIYLTTWWDKLGGMRIVLILIVVAAVLLAGIGLYGSIIAWKRKKR
jgi:hypothetical protein